MKVPSHTSTTRHLGSCYPLFNDPSLECKKVFIGKQYFGGKFTYDPFDLYSLNILTNPNIVVLGQIGRGKSSFIKTFLLREMAFGRRCLIIDPKGEYGPLLSHFGFEPIVLRPGGRHRISPIRENDNQLLYALTEIGLKRSLMPLEKSALDLAVCNAKRKSKDPNLRSIACELEDPLLNDSMPNSVSVTTLLEHSLEMSLELRRLLSSDLKGVMDSTNSLTIDYSNQIISIDLSYLQGTDSLGVGIACVLSLVEDYLSSNKITGGFFIVIDEAWAVLTNSRVANFFQMTWKLSRSYGVSNIAVIHRASDLTDQSNSSVKVGGLLSDSETKIIYAQSESEASNATKLFNLSLTEERYITQLPLGRALWKVGSRSFLVDHLLGLREAKLINTDQKMDLSISGEH